MKTVRFLPLVALIAFTAGFWTACTIGFDIDEKIFSCTTDEDCISPKVCKGGTCESATDSGMCTDEDDDGFGVGDEAARETCRMCAEQGQCAEDCNDGNPGVSPGVKETCDGLDNDCDEEIDEPLDCDPEDPLACPEEPGTIPSCEGGTCVYKPPNQLGECAGITLGCVDGERETPPAECQ